MRAYNGAHSLLLMSPASNFNDQVIWGQMQQEFLLVLILVKHHAQNDRRMKEELMDTLNGKEYNLLHLLEDWILRGGFQICLLFVKLLPPPEDIQRETTDPEVDPPLQPRCGHSWKSANIETRTLLR